MTYRGQLREDPAIVVRAAGGQPIALDLIEVGPVTDGSVDGSTPATARVILAKAKADLLPNTTYEILDRVVHLCMPGFGADAGSHCLLPEPAVVSTFVTGASSDHTAPTFGGVNAVNVGDLEVCDGGSCCGPYAGYRVTLRWTPAYDDHSADFVRYNVYSHAADGGATSHIVARFVAAELLRGGILCKPAPPPYPSYPFSALGITLKGTYWVRAVDAAGNEDQNAVSVEVGKDCPVDGDGGFADASTDVTPDGSDVPGDVTTDHVTPDSSDVPADATTDQLTPGSSDAVADGTTGPTEAGSHAAHDSSTGVGTDTGTPPNAPPDESSGCSLTRSRDVSARSTLAFFGGLLALATCSHARRGRRRVQ